MSDTVKKILGIDIGNYNIKTSSGFSIASKLETRHINANKDDLRVIYNGQAYTIGSDAGALNIGANKYKKNHFKICLLTAIAKSCSDNKKHIHCKVVIGVPIETYNNKSVTLDIKNTILSWGRQKITVDGKEKEITIHNAEIFLESGIVFGDTKKFSNKRTLVIDIGGSTVDVSMWQGLKLIDFKTYKEGLITLQSKIISMVNERENTTLKIEVAEKMIGKNEFIIKTEKRNISYINQQIENYILGLASYIVQNFDVDSCDNIQLIGGGAEVLERWLKEEFTKAELYGDAPFANANTYEKVGAMIWAAA